jgi:hypothetical protein
VTASSRREDAPVTAEVTTGVASPDGHQLAEALGSAGEPITEFNSANAGMLIHRVGQLKYEYRDEGLRFGVDLDRLINEAQRGYITIAMYEEIFGTHNRMHWLLHMKAPNDYQRLLDMVDHDAEWQEVSLSDRLPEKGGGNWERMFVEGSMSEAILAPQHGFTHAEDDDDDRQYFQPPARNQAHQPADQMLHSRNAPFTVHRAAQVKYAFRKEARYFLFEWAGRVNEVMAGSATAFMYEETWGLQDRLHLLIHLRSLDDYHRLLELPRTDEGCREILAKQRVHDAKGGGGWERTFVEGSIVDSLWVPRD